MDDPESGYLNLESKCLALAIGKKTLDKNRFMHGQKTTDCTPPNFKIGDRVNFQNKVTWKMGSNMESWLQDYLYRVQQTLPPYRNQATGKTGPCNIKDVVYELPV